MKKFNVGLQLYSVREDMAKDFEGSMKDKEVIEILGISRNTYYKYKKELLLGGIK